MELTPRRGDSGFTNLGKTRVSKTDPRIKFMSLMDEMQAYVGLLHTYKCNKEINNRVSTICNHFYEIMGLIHKTGNPSEEDLKPYIEYLDNTVNVIKLMVPKVNVFIRPNKDTCIANLVRARCRSIEVELRILELNPHISVYFNRLSSVVYGIMLYYHHNKYNPIETRLLVIYILNSE